MKVSELIEVLKTMPQDMEVFSRYQERGTFAKPGVSIRESDRIARGKTVLAIEGAYYDKVEGVKYEDWIVAQPQAGNT